MTSTTIVVQTLFLFVGAYSFRLNYLDEPLKSTNFSDLYQIDNSYDDPSNEEYNSYSNEIFDNNRMEAMYPRNKKSMALCTLKKHTRTHVEEGYEFYPKQYSEYECVPVHSDNEKDSYQNTCRAQSCITMHKHQKHLKKKIGQQCWQMDQIKVDAGCNCIFSY